MQAEDIMTVAPVSISPETEIREAIQKLEELDIRHLPIVDAQKLVGIISERDLGCFMVHRLGLMEPRYAEILLSQPVSELMQSDLVTAYPESSVQELITKIRKYKIGVVPIIQDEDRLLVGIVSYEDLLEKFSKILSQ